MERKILQGREKKRECYIMHGVFPRSAQHRPQHLHQTFDFLLCDTKISASITHSNFAPTTTQKPVTQTIESEK